MTATSAVCQGFASSACVCTRAHVHRRRISRSSSRAQAAYLEIECYRGIPSIFLVLQFFRVARSASIGISTNIGTGTIIGTSTNIGTSTHIGTSTDIGTI